MTNTYDKNEMKRKVRKLKIVECKKIGRAHV